MSEPKICKACGTEYRRFDPGEICVICTDDRQYVPVDGQQWTSHNSLLKDHRVQVNMLRENLYELRIVPSFAIGQRALLYLSPHGNILWDCIPLLTAEVVSFIKSRGGLKAIAISHPHFFSNMHAWGEAFHCPVYINAYDKEWIVAPGDYIKFWNEESINLTPNIRIIRIGGHFPGSSVLHIKLDSQEKPGQKSDRFSVDISSVETTLAADTTAAEISTADVSTIDVSAIDVSTVDVSKIDVSKIDVTNESVRNGTSEGLVFSGDTVLISLNGKHVSAMYSYPNRVPLPLLEVQRIFSYLLSLEFTALYSAFPNLSITENVKEILSASLARYV